MCRFSFSLLECWMCKLLALSRFGPLLLSTNNIFIMSPHGIYYMSVRMQFYHKCQDQNCCCRLKDSKSVIMWFNLNAWRICGKAHHYLWWEGALYCIRVSSLTYTVLACLVSGMYWFRDERIGSFCINPSFHPVNQTCWYFPAWTLLS